MSQLDTIENKFEEAFVKKAPFQLPENAKKWIVQYSPYIGLVLGILGLWAALLLWRAAHRVNELIEGLDAFTRAYGVNTGVDEARLGVLFWLSFFALVAQSAVSIIAFPGLKERSKKRGWDLLFYSALFSLVYGVFNAFYDKSFMSLVSSLIGSVIGFYFLFQIRSYYTAKKEKSS